MYPVTKLHERAAQLNIPVRTFPLPQTRSMSLRTEAGCVIGLDPGVQDGSVREREHLSHELGHCATGSFYSRYASRDLRERHENRADKWAIRELIPLRAFDDAIATGHTTIWELAEHFGVTENLMRKAVCLYTHGNLAANLYF